MSDNEVLVNQRVENAMTKRLQEIALVGMIWHTKLLLNIKAHSVDCEDEIAAFAKCNEGR
jgi:hypothetical protein